LGSKNTPSVPSSVTSAQTADMNSLTQIAQQQSSNANQLYNLTEPGMAQGLSFYESLASGDPFQIARADAPVAQQASQAAQGASQNIINNLPGGGTKDLALEQNQLQQAATVGNAGTQGYLGAQNALLQAGGQGIGLSQGASGLGISSLGTGGGIASSAGQLSLSAQQLGLEQKGQTLGAYSSLGGDAASIGSKALFGGMGG
jgi:hypothetical protein